MEYTITVPIKVNISSKKSFRLNLNEYRNTHYFTLNKAKKQFSVEVKPLLFNLPKLNKINIKYTLYPQRKCDLSNVCCIVDKFFCDCLIEYFKLEDDNIDFINQVTFVFGSLDKQNPRVEILIKEI